jgi:hypothetical protein
MAPRTGIPPRGIAPISGATGTAPAGTATKQFNGSLETTPTVGATNQVVANTNGFNGTNNINGTNALGNNGLGTTNNVTATVTPLTNFPVTVNSNFNGNVVVPDQAVTPSDRILLTTLSQGVRATLGITPNGNTPVHFLIQNGTVTVVGTVQSTEQSQAVLSQVQQTPGVLSVINGMHVAGSFAPAAQSPTAGASLLGTPTDRAFSPADQTLLTTVQQEAALQLGITSSAQMPVHFSIENGVVGVTGYVASLQVKQALIAAIQRTRGIVRVVDNVSVVSSGNTGITSGNVGATGTTLSPTSRDMNQSNFLVTTNSSGF